MSKNNLSRRFFACLGAALVLSSSGARPARAETGFFADPNLSIDSSQTVFERLPSGNAPGGAAGKDDFNNTVGEINSIINIGKELWQVVVANQPVVSTSQNSATAVPEGTKHWTELDGWQNPQVRNYQITLKNGYGASVVKFAYQLQFNAGGSRERRGHYLANVTIRATQVDVLWGYTFNADATVGDIVNVGAHEDPIAGVTLTLSWKVGTPLKKENGSRTFFVRGDGQVADLSQQ